MEISAGVPRGNGKRESRFSVGRAISYLFQPNLLLQTDTEYPRLSAALDFLGRHTLDWQVVTGIATTAIALCALVFTIWQGIQARRHNVLSFRPHLTTWTHNNTDKGFFAVELLNNGLGPALIEEFLVKVDGRVISGQGTEPIEKGLKISFPNLEYTSHHGYVGKGYSMAAKERVTIAAIQFIKQPFPSSEFVAHAFNRASLEITYKSFYEERFHFSTQDEKANKQIQPTI